MRKIFDFNIHLPFGKNDTAELLEIEANQKSIEIKKGLSKFLMKFKDINFEGLNIMLFNENLPFLTDELDEIIRFTNSMTKNSIFTQLFNFRKTQDLSETFKKMKLIGVNGIKFHSYVQKIEENDFPLVISSAVEAAKHNLFICIDASYGTTGMYKYDNLKLASEIIEKIKNVPIIILHSGGLRCIEAMLLAINNENVFLETSFSLPVYKNSTVEENLAFVYKNLGSKKIIYASDYPYIDCNDSLKCIEDFFKKFDFDTESQENILFKNALRILN